MTAILGGLGAAVLWATSNLISSRAGRLIGADSTLGAMMLVGLIGAMPFAVASGPLPPISVATSVWLVASGLGSVIGLLFLYRGLRVGKVGVVTALSSTEGAIAAVISVVAGEHLNAAAVVMLAVIAVGIARVALAAGGAATAQPDAVGGAPGAAIPIVLPAAAAHHERRAVMFGVAAALCFGVSIYATGQAGQVLPPFVALLPARIAGVVGVLIPLALTGRVRMTRPAVPMVVAIGLGELFGNAAFILGARESIAIAAVISSQYAAVAAIAAFFLFHERLSVGQRGGVLAIAAGVAILTAVRG
jgi:drug/metabolite transporter (DMT)-like permease